MSGPFVSEEEFEITVKYVEKEMPNGMIGMIVVKSKETEDRYQGLVKSITTMWVEPDWRKQNEMIRKAMMFDPMSGRREMDYTIYRQQLLEQCMKKWNVTIKRGKEEGEEADMPVPCTPENINKLNPAIAGALVDAFTEKTSMPEEELGN